MIRSVFAMMTLALPVWAESTGETPLPPQYHAVESYSGVPAQVLYAVALAESGRGAGKARKPHPWTLNIAGKPHYFDSRQAMFEALMNALQSGISNVDIGPLQLNWHWQFERLTSPWNATDPIYNLKTASAILAEHYAKTGDWWQAVGKYHRAADAPEHRAAAGIYSARVQRIWEAL